MPSTTLVSKEPPPMEKPKEAKETSLIPEDTSKIQDFESQLENLTLYQVGLMTTLKLISLPSVCGGVGQISHPFSDFHGSQNGFKSIRNILGKCDMVTKMKVKSHNPTHSFCYS
jgi:hypothetical protein